VLERASVLSDELAECGVVVAQDVEELLGRRGLGERGEAAQVEEEARDVRAMAGQELLAALARDQLGHLGRQESRELGALPLDGPDQARVRQRDRGLVGEGLEQPDMRLVEGLRPTAHDDDHSDQFVLDRDGHAEHRAVVARAGVAVVRVELDVRNQNRRLQQGGAAGCRRPVDRVGMHAVVRARGKPALV
jgi:hypothetical protein